MNVQYERLSKQYKVFTQRMFFECENRADWNELKIECASEIKKY